MPKKFWVIFILVVLLAAALATLLNGAEAYRATNLDAVVGGGVHIEPRAINNRGEIATVYTQPLPVTIPPDFGSSGAVVNEDGFVAFVGNPWGADNQKIWWPSAISSSGVVTGTTGSGFSTISLIWNGAAMTTLDALQGSIDTRARGINDAGIVAGSGLVTIYQNGDLEKVPHALVADAEATADIHSYIGGGDASHAYDINNHNVVVGERQVGSQYYPYRYSIDTNELVSLARREGATWGRASAINDAGDVVGVTGGRAALWQNDELVDLGDLAGMSASWANAINAGGTIVGEYYLSATGDDRVFVWKSGTGIQDLNSLIADWTGTLVSADGINDSGQIIGLGYDASGIARGYLLTPLQTPEPPTGPMVLVAIFFAFIGRLWYRSR